MGFIFSTEKVVYVLLLIFVCLENFGSNAQLLPEDEGSFHYFKSTSQLNFFNFIFNSSILLSFEAK